MQQIYSIFQICFRTYPEQYIRQPNYLNPIYIFSLHPQKQRNYSLNPKMPTLLFFHFHLYDLKYYF
nr:MAG TPA: hypothetical protein [Caudoviricetes sp.]